jgi:hypothetical protein
MSGLGHRPEHDRDGRPARRLGGPATPRRVGRQIRAGEADHARRTLPGVLGLDLAGVVEEVGAGIGGLAPGAYTGHVVSDLGWGTHSITPLSFRGATYSGVFTLLPLLTGRGREHHGEIMRESVALAGAGALTPLLAPRHFTLADVATPTPLWRAAPAKARS